LYPFNYRMRAYKNVNVIVKTICEYTLNFICFRNKVSHEGLLLGVHKKLKLMTSELSTKSLVI